MTYFTIVSLRTATGFMMITMATSISLRRLLTRPAVGSPMQMDTGSGPTAAGTGPRTKISDGPLTITAVGLTSTARVGSGSQAANGRQPGSPGERVTITRAGLPYRQNPLLVTHSASPPGVIRITTSAPLHTFLSDSAIGSGRVTGATSRRLPRTSISSTRPETSPTFTTRTMSLIISGLRS